MQDCVFCKIINKQIKSEIIEETNSLIVIKDISPKAPIHYLIIPKKHIKDIQSFRQKDFALASDMFEMAQKISKKMNGDFRIVINSGPSAGQCIFHMHMHFLAGSPLPAFE